MRLKRLFFVFNILAVMSLLVQGGGYQTAKAGLPVHLEGTFIIIWGDGTPGSGETRISYFLLTKQNENIQLSIDEELLTSVGGPTDLNQKAIVVLGTWLDAGTILQAQSITLANGEQVGSEGIYGPQPWVSILCKFSDYADEPRNLAYFEGMFSSVYPGLDHYWRELSYNLINLQGSKAHGWFTLPYPRSHYLPGGSLDKGAAAQDCTSAADPYVNFSSYIGVNLMFNYELDGYAWGGRWPLCLDGNCGIWRVTWEPPWGYENVSTLAHEQGHGFGLPHSSGNYGQTYDNVWDIMSDNWAPCSLGGDDPVFGCIGQHTISYHKDLLGWIPTARKFTASPGIVQTIILERLAWTQTGNYLAAFVPISGTPGQFYTVEARQLVGYDAHNPGSAVIIHQVDPSRDNQAHVIDIDGNGNTGDAGAMWVQGESFIDLPNHIQIKVLSVTPTGFVVLIDTAFTPLSGVEINGPTQSHTCADNTFIATVSPANASTPITYLWEASGQETVTHTRAISDTMVYQWTELGTQTITVTASTAGVSVSSTHTIHIDTLVTCLTLDGPGVAWPGDTLTFTASVAPLTTTVPLTYTWVVEEQSPVTHTNGLVDTASYTWLTPGIYVLFVTAINPDVTASDTWTVIILLNRYLLPIIYRH